MYPKHVHVILGKQQLIPAHSIPSLRSSVLSDANFLAPSLPLLSSPVLGLLSAKGSTALALSSGGGPLTRGSPFSLNSEAGPGVGSESCSIPARESWIVLRK